MDIDHPKGHVSFGSTHSKEPFNEIQVPKLNAHGETVGQMLWPDHCVQDTPGCRIEEGVQARLDALGPEKVKYIRKV
jgi:nicotinamidase-related amidase